MIKKPYLLIFLFIFTYSCGFKVIKQEEIRNFNIEELVLLGDNKVNFFLKKRILREKIGGKQPIKLTLESKKVKIIKEKNITRRVLKNEIKISVIVNYSLVGSKASNNFTITRSGIVSVGLRHSVTVKKERILIEDLSRKIADAINENLINQINEL